MWRLIGGLLLLLSSLCWVSAVHGQACIVAGQSFVAVSYQEYTVSTTALGLDLSGMLPAATSMAQALVTVEAATIRFTFTGEPTGTSGHELLPGNHFFICGRAMMASFRAIRSSQGSQDALMRVSISQPQ